MTDSWERHDAFRSCIYAIASISGHDAEAALSKFKDGQTKLYGNPVTEWPKMGQCLWIDGDVREWTATFCGQPVKRGSSYCKHHHKICYREADPWEVVHSKLAKRFALTAAKSSKPTSGQQKQPAAISAKR